MVGTILPPTWCRIVTIECHLFCVIISPDLCYTNKKGEFCLGKKSLVLGKGGIISSANKLDCNEVACGLSNSLV